MVYLSGTAEETREEVPSGCVGSGGYEVVEDPEPAIKVGTGCTSTSWSGLSPIGHLTLSDQVLERIKL